MLKKLLFIMSISTICFGGSNIGLITTGGEDGTYIQIGKDISKLFKKYNVDLEVKKSEGSLDNLRRIVGLDTLYPSNWAIVQNDVLKYYKYKYYKETKYNLNSKVKIILPLYNEDIHIFKKKDKTIKFEVGDVITVGVKSEKSGGYITSKVIQNSYGVEFNFIYCDFETAKQYLQKGVIDIFVDVTAKPNKSYTNLKDIDFVTLPENKIMDENYSKTLFTKEEYPWLKKNHYGYACTSVLVTNLVDAKYNKVVKFFVEAILQNSKELQSAGHSRWSEVYKNLKSHSKNFNYHPQVVKSISYYKTKF